MTEQLVLIGGGGHCKACIDVIEKNNLYKIFGILDPSKRENNINGYPIIGDDNDILQLVKKNYSFLITIGHIYSNDDRKKIFFKLKSVKAKLATIISPRAYVSPRSSIGEGTIVMHDVLVNSNSIIGSNCILNTKSIIEHDVQINDNCHISTGAILNGGVVVGQDTFVGSNATSQEGACIPERSFVKSGTIITR